MNLKDAVRIRKIPSQLKWKQTQRKEQATSNRNDQEKSILEIEAASLSILTTLLSQRFRKK